MNLAQQITKIYLEEEAWHNEKISQEEADAYHESALNNGHIITVSDGDKLVGYCEYYINHGICLVHNLFIYPEYRNGQAIRMIRKRLFAKGAKVFHGERYKNGQVSPHSQLRSQDG